jgi:hypothetical protein
MIGLIPLRRDTVSHGCGRKLGAPPGRARSMLLDRFGFWRIRFDAAS